MIGITLSADQIRNAPAQVQAWIETAIAAELGLVRARQEPRPQQIAHLVACSAEDIEGVLAQIQHMLPAMDVLFEFSRQAVSYGEQRVMAFRLLDIRHHCRLQSVGHVTACLEMINDALAKVRRDPTVRFCGYDNEGHCLVLAETRQSVAAVWQKTVARHESALAPPAA